MIKRAKSRVVVSMVMAFAVAAPAACSTDSAACAKDSDCKGARICQDGVCADADGGAGGNGGDGRDGGSDVGGACAADCTADAMVTVPAGSFQMGCNSAVDTECGDDEKPYHTVTLSAFRMDAYEVTAAEYKSCVGSGGCTAAGTSPSTCTYDVPGMENHPINCVSWIQAEAFCAWAGKRLPTEAEWEKTSRGTDGRKYPWGNDPPDCNHAVHSANGCSNAGTAPIGGKPAGASPYGAEDMIGNVWEWVNDRYGGTYYSFSPAGDPPGPASGTSHVLRGGSWYNTSSQYGLRASDRYESDPAYRAGDVGFRCGAPSL